MKTHSVRTASSQALTSDFKSFVFLTDSSESQGTHIPHLLCVLSVRSPRIFSAFLIMKVTFTNPHKTKSKRNFPEFRAQKKRVMGIEPTYPAWKAGVLPLNYTRIISDTIGILSQIVHKCKHFFLKSGAVHKIRAGGALSSERGVRPVFSIRSHLYKKHVF